MPVRFGDAQVDQKSVSVVHERLAAAAQLRFPTVALAHELRFGVRLRFVGLVGARRAAEVSPALAVSVVSLLGTEALERSPCLDERPVHAEVLRAEQVRSLGLLD